MKTTKDRTEGTQGTKMAMVRSVEREFELFGTVIPAMVSAEVSPLYHLNEIPGRKRTPYFYRKMAISFRRDMRAAWSQEMRECFKRLALSYLASYRKLKAEVAA
jgi:hypothetical protein